MNSARISRCVVSVVNRSCVDEKLKVVYTYYSLGKQYKLGTTCSSDVVKCAVNFVRQTLLNQIKFVVCENEVVMDNNISSISPVEE